MNKKLLSRTFNVSLALGFLALSLSSVNLTRKNNSSITWYNLEEVQHLVKQEPRNVFIDVYTTWCGPCKLMDRTTFSDQKVGDYLKQNYYAVKINADSPRMVKFKGREMSEKELAKSFEVEGYPTFLLMNERFESIQSRLGYMKPGQFRRMLEEYNETPERLHD